MTTSTHVRAAAAAAVAEPYQPAAQATPQAAPQDRCRMWLQRLACEDGTGSQHTHISPYDLAVFVAQSAL